jgi:hypothetical protein
MVNKKKHPTGVPYLVGALVAALMAIALSVGYPWAGDKANKASVAEPKWELLPSGWYAWSHLVAKVGTSCFATGGIDGCLSPIPAPNGGWGGYVVTTPSQIATLPKAVRKSVEDAMAVERQYVQEAWVSPLEHFQGNPAQGVGPAHEQAVAWTSLAAPVLRSSYLNPPMYSGGASSHSQMTGAQYLELSAYFNFDARFPDFRFATSEQEWFDSDSGIRGLNWLYGPLPSNGPLTAAPMPLYVVGAKDATPVAVFVPFTVAFYIDEHQGPHYIYIATAGWTALVPSGGKMEILVPSTPLHYPPEVQITKVAPDGKVEAATESVLELFVECPSTWPIPTQAPLRYSFQSSMSSNTVFALVCSDFKTRSWPTASG